jgi:hypothetical protein
VKWADPPGPGAGIQVDSSGKERTVSLDIRDDRHVSAELHGYFLKGGFAGSLRRLVRPAAHPLDLKSEVKELADSADAIWGSLLRDKMRFST